MKRKRQNANRQKEKSASLFNRLSNGVHAFFVNILSNLRLSLTLRIALHYAAQLLKTTLLMLAVCFMALCAARVPSVNQGLDRLSQMTPATEQRFSQEQLAGLPFSMAYPADKPLGEGLPGLWERARLAFSNWQPRQPRLLLYVSTTAGGIIAVYPLDDLLYTASILLWTMLCFDLYRVVLFLKKRNRLNRKVLRPITDMAEMAATLSANNLSERLSVDGAKNELKDLALVINSMLDRIEVSYNSQKQFVSDASHELRTPIAVIQGYTSMLERWGKSDREVLDEGIAAIAQEAASMKELVDRLLFLARHDKKTLMLEMQDFNALEIMSELYREAPMLSQRHHFALNPSQNVTLYGDKDMLKQLMRILLDNAIKYTQDGGDITLGIRAEGPNCVLSVQDTGAGIPGEELSKIFGRFYRCDKARKSQTGGHGLGLSIARIIVSAHGGRLKVRSKVGAGTTFSVLLPVSGPPSHTQTDASNPTRHDFGKERPK